VTLESIGDIADVSLAEQTVAKEPDRAQMLARVGHPTGTVRTESGVSASVAQANVRRQQITQ